MALTNKDASRQMPAPQAMQATPGQVILPGDQSAMLASLLAGLTKTPAAAGSAMAGLKISPEMVNGIKDWWTQRQMAQQVMSAPSMQYAGQPSGYGEG